MWGRSIEGGRLEEPGFAPPEEIYKWTADPRKAPDNPQEVEIGFEGGVPVSVDGRKMQPVDLILHMNKLAGKHGIGRLDMMEDRLLGLKVRENYECPGAVVLLTAHKALEAFVCTKDELAFKAMVDRKWGELAYAGLWLDPLKDDLEAFIGKIQERVTGAIRMRFFKGSAIVIGRKSDFAIYSESLASFDTKEFDQRDSLGIVKTHGMQQRFYHRLKFEG
jgi:argininosuccinate synthase